MKKLLLKLLERKIAINIEDGNLKLDVPKGVDIKDILEEVKENKKQLITYIDKVNIKNRQIDFDKEQMLISATSLKDQETYDVSHQQKKEYLRYLIKGKHAFNIVFQVELPIIQDEIINKVIYTLFERHEILRTTFLIVKGQVQQKIHTHISIDFNLEYINLLDISNKEERFQNEFKESENRLFDFEKGPLISIKVIKYDGNVQGLLISMHHAISDQETTKKIKEEIQLLYNLYEKGSKQSLIPIEIQSKEHTLWVNSYLESEIGLKRIKNYKEKIENSLSLDKRGINLQENNYKKKLNKELEIALKGKDLKELPDFFGYVYNLFPKQGASYQTFINENQIAKLNHMLKLYNCSFFSLLITLFAIVFYKKDKNESLRMFIPYSGRVFEEFNDILGWLSSEMIICITIDDKLTVKDLINNVSNIILETKNYSLYPHEKIMNDLDIDLDVLSPIFLNHSRINESFIEIMQSKHMNWGSGHFTFAGTIFQYNNCIKLNVDYNPNYFTELEIENLTKDYIHFIDLLSNNSALSLRELLS